MVDDVGRRQNTEAEAEAEAQVAGGNNPEDLDDDDDDEEDDGVEEIPRDKTVQEMVDDELYRRRAKKMAGQDVLKDYMADIQDLIPDGDGE